MAEVGTAARGAAGDRPPADVQLLTNIGCLVAFGGQGESVLEEAALAWAGEEILWVGSGEAVPEEYRGGPAWDAGGRLVIPGLVDCHTHLAFGGWRDDEFEARLGGTSYQEIAREGGGIRSTMRATRAWEEDRLLRRSRGFLRGMARRGITTVEAKSGYGLRTADELKQLRVYRRLRDEGPLQVIPTFLGAHVVPPEFEDRRGAYVDLLVREMIPRVASEDLADTCDVFVEEGAFTVPEARRILEAGKEHGLASRLHADQLGDGGGAALAAEVGALSADHLEHVSEQGIEALAEAGVVAVSLPLASLYLDAPYMPARDCVDRGVPVAVATDFNPGTAPSYDLPVALLLACVRQRLTPLEALRGATLHAARACGMKGRAGSLEPGKRADFALIDAPAPRHWLYHFRGDACVATVAGGRVVWRDRSLPSELDLPAEDPDVWGGMGPDGSGEARWGARP